MQIFKRSLDGLFHSRISENRECIGLPGEDKLVRFLDCSDHGTSTETVIAILRRLSKNSSVSIILSAHRIVFVKAKDIKISYVIGETFLLNEFSLKDLDLEGRSSVKIAQVYQPKCDHLKNLIKASSHFFFNSMIF